MARYIHAKKGQNVQLSIMIDILKEEAVYSGSSLFALLTCILGTEREMCLKFYNIYRSVCLSMLVYVEPFIKAK